MLPPQAIYALFKGGQKLVNWLSGDSGASARRPNSFRYVVYAVDPAALRAFAAKHPDVMDAAELYRDMLAEPGFAASAESLRARIRQMERTHPGCVVVVADFETD